MVNKEKSVELHIVVPIEQYRKWERCKVAQYDRAMAKMIRDAVDEYVARHEPILTGVK